MFSKYIHKNTTSFLKKKGGEKTIFLIKPCVYQLCSHSQTWSWKMKTFPNGKFVQINRAEFILPVLGTF